MAQRTRAGLITPRSLDQNGLPVFFIKKQNVIKYDVYKNMIFIKIKCL